jgi:hypothetical protein
MSSAQCLNHYFSVECLVHIFVPSRFARQPGVFGAMTSRFFCEVLESHIFCFSRIPGMQETDMHRGLYYIQVMVLL